MTLSPGDRLDGGRLRLDEKLGEGAFGSVWRATEFLGFGAKGDLIALREVAVKCLPPLHRGDDAELVIEEARALASLDHEAILRLYDAFADDAGTYLVTELATEGDLRRYFDDSIPTEPELRELLFAVCGGLAYLHEHGSVHGDLKPENVLVTASDAGDVRFLLGDFGLRALIGHRNFQGTVPFIPPEVYSPTGGILTDRSDIYALGVLLYEVAAGSRLTDLIPRELVEPLRSHTSEPARIREAHALIGEMIDGTDWKRLELPTFLRTLLRLCLDENPARRPSARGVVELWAAFERNRRGMLLPCRDEGRPDGRRYQIPFARIVDIVDEGGSVYEEPTLTAHIAGEGGALAQVSVGQRTNPAMYSALDGLRTTLADEPAMASIVGIVPVEMSELRFAADRRSYLVVEPFELVDVTDLSRSHHCVRAYVHRLLGVDANVSRPLLKGNILHALFADLLADPALTFDAGWALHWPGSCLDLAYVLGSSDALRGFRRDIEEGFRLMRRAFLSEPAWMTPLRHIESTRWSLDLGLSGRVDAFFMSEGSRASAYELKTGKVRPDDLLQVQAYVAMLLEDVRRMRDDDRRPVRNAPLVRAQILTSSDGRLRPVNAPPPYGQLAHIRNQILHVRRVLAEPRHLDERLPLGYPYFGYDRAKCERCARVQPYLYRACRQTTAQFGERHDLDGPTLSPLEHDYFWHWTRLLLREEEALRRRYLYPVLEAMFEGQTAELPDPRARTEPRITDAVLTGREDLLLRFEFTPTVAEFHVGDDALLHRGDLHRWHEVLRVVVRDVTDTSMSVEVRSPHVLRGLSEHADGPWVIEFFPNIRNVDTLRRGLRLFIESQNEAMKALVLGGRMPRRQGALFPAGPPEGLELAIEPQLNAQQRNALLRALDQTGFLSITGPPGTGKTLTIHAIVEAYVRQGGRVLIAGLTNNAVDNVVERLIGPRKGKTLPFVRVGTGSAIQARFSERLQRMGQDPRRFFAHELGTVFEELDDLRAHLDSVPIFIGTAHSLIRSPWVTGRAGEAPPFDLVIVDEATQVQEPLAAGLLVLGRKAILVGDERQLGPVCVSTFDADAQDIPESLRDIEIGGLDLSLFERLNRLLRQRGEEEGQVFLSHQYRMHATIGRWASDQFYEGRLETASVVRTRSTRLVRARERSGWHVLKRVLDPDHPLVFLDVPASDGDAPNTCVEEARIAAMLVAALRELGIEDVGCITPYRNQQVLLRRELQRRDLMCECGTVDAFQGREKAVIILSTVRRDRLTEFLKNPRRLNVSITRARSKCIILGSRAILREHPLLWDLVGQDSCLRETIDREAIERELDACSGSSREVKG